MQVVDRKEKCELQTEKKNVDCRPKKKNLDCRSKKNVVIVNLMTIKKDVKQGES